MVSRYFRRTILFLTAATIIFSLTVATIVIGQQTLFVRTAVVQAQENLPPVVPLQWTGYRYLGIYPDANTACKEEYEILDPDFPRTLRRVEFYKAPSYPQSAKCWMEWWVTDGETDFPVDALCPNGYIYTGGTNGECFLPSSNEEETTTGENLSDDAPDYSSCSYYDYIADQYGCKYHKVAAEICRDEYTGVEIFNTICSISEAQKNCLRPCLVNADELARSNSASYCRTQSGQGNCTRRSCIDAYHNICFSQCGINVNCYGGNWSSLYPNDGDE